MNHEVFSGKYAEIARENFASGCNCSQAVLAAFADICGISRKTALLLGSSFGGGIGRLREVCGAVSGMCMAAGMLYGYDDLDDHSAKSQHYERIQFLAEEFKRINGSYVCRELLGLNVQKEQPVPEKRTPEYYKKRPCSELCACAASILDAYISEHPIN